MEDRIIPVSRHILGHGQNHAIADVAFVVACSLQILNLVCLLVAKRLRRAVAVSLEHEAAVGWDGPHKTCRTDRTQDAYTALHVDCSVRIARCVLVIASKLCGRVMTFICSSRMLLREGSRLLQATDSAC